MKTTDQNDTVQCQYFVQRKKRFCRMTVRPGRSYCGEHEPKPTNEDGEPDSRVPCPLDPKHTCYVSKLEKHLSICNARVAELPPYIVKNVNVPNEQVSPRLLLSQIPAEFVLQVIDKINKLYESILENKIETLVEREIHPVVVPEFEEASRTETSRRHLRQTSRLMWLLEEEGLVQDGTCYVELGAGKGQLSYYECLAWCGGAGDSEAGSGSEALLVDRAALRHKRDNKLVRGSTRLRVDLADLLLQETPPVRACRQLVGIAKHLCGAGTDLALRCLAAAAADKAGGAVMATCCHHRCDRATFFANEELHDMGISEEEFNAMLGIVSWATCGDKSVQGSIKARAGRKAKALLDEARARGLRRRGFHARLCRFVPEQVSLENICIVAKKTQ